jgi:hypothetical protein
MTHVLGVETLVFGIGDHRMPRTRFCGKKLGSRRSQQVLPAASFNGPRFDFPSTGCFDYQTRHDLS